MISFMLPFKLIVHIRNLTMTFLIAKFKQRHELRFLFFNDLLKKELSIRVTGFILFRV